MGVDDCVASAVPYIRQTPALIDAMKKLFQRSVYFAY